MQLTDDGFTDGPSVLYIHYLKIDQNPLKYCYDDNCYNHLMGISINQQKMYLYIKREGIVDKNRIIFNINNNIYYIHLQ